MSSWASNVNAPVKLGVKLGDAPIKDFVFEKSIHRLHIAVLALSLFLAVAFYPLEFVWILGKIGVQKSFAIWIALGLLVLGVTMLSLNMRGYLQYANAKWKSAEPKATPAKDASAIKMTNLLSPDAFKSPNAPKSPRARTKGLNMATSVPDFGSPLQHSFLEEGAIISQGSAQKMLKLVSKAKVLEKEKAQADTDRDALLRAPGNGDVVQEAPLFAVSAYQQKSEKPEEDSTLLVSSVTEAKLEARAIRCLSEEFDVANAEAKMRDKWVPQLKARLFEHIDSVLAEYGEADKYLEEWRAHVCSNANIFSTNILLEDEKKSMQSGSLGRVANLRILLSKGVACAAQSWKDWTSKLIDQFGRVLPVIDMASGSGAQHGDDAVFKHVLGRLGTIARTRSLNMGAVAYSHLPTDAQIIMHVFKTELNQRFLEIKRPHIQHQGALFHAANAQGGLFLKPQAQQAVSIPSLARFFVTTPIDDLNRRTLSRDFATIIQLRRAPPTCFVVAAGQGARVWPPQAGRDSVFQTIVLFVRYLDLNSDAQLDGFALTKSKICGFLAEPGYFSES